MNQELSIVRAFEAMFQFVQKCGTGIPETFNYSRQSSLFFIFNPNCFSFFIIKQRNIYCSRNMTDVKFRRRSYICNSDGLREFQKLFDINFLNWHCYVKWFRTFPFESHFLKYLANSLLRSSILTGLGIKSLIPEISAFFFVSGILSAVNATIITDLSNFTILCADSKPSISGITRSIKMRSNFLVLARRYPA